MTNEQILEKAIEKVVKNGWKGDKEWEQEIPPYKWYPQEVTHTIFSHDFAKAFWGEEPEHFDVTLKNPRDFNPEKGMKFDEVMVTQPNWQYNLQQMVLEKEPLKYLEKFL